MASLQCRCLSFKKVVNYEITPKTVGFSRFFDMVVVFCNDFVG